jgi:hypothetical protein
MPVTSRALPVRHRPEKTWDLAVISRIVCALALMLLPGAASPATTSSVVLELPGPINRLMSPDHRYAVENRDAEGDTDDEIDTDINGMNSNHDLFLIDKYSRSAKFIYAYQRGGSVSWSGDSQKLAITDAEGSDYEDCIVYFVEDDRQICIADEITTSGPFDLRAAMGQKDHIYISGQGWANDNTARVKIEGEGNDVDVPDLEVEALYTIGKGIKIVKWFGPPRLRQIDKMSTQTAMFTSPRYWHYGRGQ